MNKDLKLEQIRLENEIKDLKSQLAIKEVALAITKALIVIEKTNTNEKGVSN